jgi:uncharacterized protein YyaL (SSP411 family)
VLASDFRFSPHPNKANLIKWRHWEKQTLDEARKENRPILLSLSAVWCHWCHVMDETTYSDNEIIEYINSNLIPVRVDSDMRPDIDSLYNQGGWPSTIVLTPKGEVVSGGTYIPPESMIAWLSDALKIFHEGEKKSRAKSDTVNEKSERGQIEGPTHDISAVDKITVMLESSFDRRYGGFGRSQKFPNADAIDFLLSEYLIKKTPVLKTIIYKTLQNMSEGAIHDHVEGGFFRYSTEADWSAPHYEKMLDLNAAMIRNYASAYMVFGDDNFRKIANNTISYVKEYLYNREIGAFLGSQDADEDYYRSSNRASLKPPHVDRTIYADSNARMITALIIAHGATGDEGLIKAAKQTADFLLDRLYSDKQGTYHYYFRQRHLSGLLSDNALFGLALVDLYNVTGEKRYISAAENIASLIMNKFYRKKEGQFIPALETTSVTPAATGVLSDYNTYLANYRALITLNRLYHYKGNALLRNVIEKTTSVLSTVYETYPPSAPLYGTALRWDMEPPVNVTIIAGDSNVSKFLLQANRIYIPRKIVKILSLDRDKTVIKKLGYGMKEAAYVCLRNVCSPPFGNPESLTSDIGKFLEIISGRTKAD